MKSISEGSAADLSNKIQINDRIVEVDGHSLQGYSNHEAVEVLRRTGQTVVLCLERYLRGPKYDQLQQAIAASELRLPQPSSPSITSLPSFPISAVFSLKFVFNKINIFIHDKIYNMDEKKDCLYYVVQNFMYNRCITTTTMFLTAMRIKCSIAGWRNYY